MGEPVQQRPGEAFRAEYLGPLIEGQVGGHHDGTPLVALAEYLEEQFSAGAGEGHEAQLVDDQQVEPGELPLQIEQPPLVPGLHQLVDQAGGGGETHGVVSACRKLKVRFSITVRLRQSLRDLIEAIPEADWTPIPYWMDGAADVAETAYTPFRSKPDAAPVRLIVRRVKPAPGSQLALFATYSYHGFITDRDGETLELEADHRRHAEIENAIRDLKYGVVLNHLPSGRFAANAAWLAAQVMAHNLARWTARIGLGEQTVTTKTLRRRFFIYGRTAYPLGAQTHFASSPGLALG